MKTKTNLLFIIILALSPFIIYWLTILLPTFDDWTYFTRPDYDFGEHFYDRLMPHFSYWRPWDGMFGYILHLYPDLFPALNHIVVYIAHLGGTYIVYRISKELGFKHFACSVATLYFFISPAMLGTVLGIDSINQAYASFWGLLATYIYIRKRSATSIALWLLCTTIGLFAKENAIVFFVIPPIIAYAFKRISLRQGMKDIAMTIIIILCYFAARKLLTSDVVYINDEYFENTFARKFKNVCVFLGMTWLPIDFVSLVHAPNRNILIVLATALLSFPFMAVAFWCKRKYIKSIPFIALVVCLLISVSPHIVTLFTAMHTYAGLGMAALIVGFLVDKSANIPLLKKLLPLFVISCLFIDWHHWQKSYESGLIGRRMAEEAIRKTGKPVDRVCLIIVKDDYPKYSSFCVIPSDAFGWGEAAYAYTGYKWPETIDIQDIDEYDKHKVDSIVNWAVANHFEKVWIIEKGNIDVIQ